MKGRASWRDLINADIISYQVDKTIGFARS